MLDSCSSTQEMNDELFGLGVPFFCPHRHYCTLVERGHSNAAPGTRQALLSQGQVTGLKSSLPPPACAEQPPVLPVPTPTGYRKPPSPPSPFHPSTRSTRLPSHFLPFGAFPHPPPAAPLSFVLISPFSSTALCPRPGVPSSLVAPKARSSPLPVASINKGALRPCNCAPLAPEA